MLRRESGSPAKFAAPFSRILAAAGVSVVFALSLGAATLDRAVTLRGAPPATCGDFLANPPTPVTSFAVTDAYVTVVFSISGGKVGDVAAVTYITPAGQVYAPASGPWPAFGATDAAAAHVCMMDTALAIAGTSVANTPGTWSVRISFNNTVLTTLTFTIGAGAPTCSYSLSASSASPGSTATTGAFQVTAGSGCAWTAASNSIQWLTVTSGSSGSGSGSVGWSVTSNSAAAYRTGTIMVTGGAQNLAFTVTQAPTTTSTGGVTISLASDPGTVSDSLFYYTNLASIGGTPALSNFDMRDAFGGTFTSSSGENGHTIFSDSPPFSGYYSLNFQTKTPVQLSSYALYLGDDGLVNPASRSATRAVILAGASADSLSVLSDTSIMPLGSTYNKAFGGIPVSGQPFPIKLAAALAGAPTYQYFELRLYPNNGTYAGVRILEFVGSGTSSAGSCTYSLSPTSASPAAGAGTGSFQVTAGSGCAWTASSSATGWLTVTGSASGSGNGTVNYAVTANTGTSSRTATITVQDKTFTVTQAGSSGSGTTTMFPIDLTSYVNDDTRNYSGSPLYPTGPNTFLNVPFIIPSISNGWNAWRGSGTGASTLGIPIGVTGATSVYFILNSIWGVPGNPGDPATSKAYIKFDGPGGITYTKNLYGNVDIRDYNSGSYANSINGTTTQNVWSDGGHRMDMMRVDLPAAFANSSLLSITLTDLGADGVQRLLLKGITVATGSGASATCSYSLTPTSASPSSAAAAGSFQVGAASGCAWTATGNNTSWLTVSGSASGSGNGTVNYAVTANTGTASRTGTITVQDKTFTVTQTGSTPAPPAGGNLLSNPGAEEGTASPDYTGLKTIPGWTTDGNVTICAYAGTCSGTLVPSSPGPPDRGNNFFGGSYAASSVMSQVVDVSGAAGPIDAGTQPYTLGGWLGGYLNQGDNVIVKAAFRDAASGTLGTVQIGPVTAAERSNATALLFRSTSGTLPARTRTVLVTVEFIRTDGSANDGYADNISFTLSAGAAPTCTYSLSPTSASPSSAAASGSFQVTAASGCAWTATGNNTTWLTVSGSASGSGNGTVNYAVTANTATASRTGTIAVQDKTFTVTQAGASVSPANCTYDLSVSGSGKMSPPGEGANSAIYVSTQAGCQWTATTYSPGWISITKGQSGTGNGEVDFLIPANPNISPRTGTMTIANKNVIMTQAAGKPAEGGPAIKSVSNAASQTSASLASGGIAQGAIFSLTGANLGPGDPADPATGVKAGAPPLAASLGGVTVQVKQGGNTMTAYPVFAWANRVDAIMPSNAALGAVTITLTYKGVASLVAPATVVATNFGAYATSGSSGGRAVLMVQSSPIDPGVQNSNTQTARPGQTVTLIGTGLGAIAGSDNSAPPTDDILVSLQILVGTQTVAPLHSGRLPGQPGKDRIQFQVPADALSSCNLPLQVVTNGTIYSNIVTMAIDAGGQACTSLNPWTGMAEKGGKLANVMLIRAQASPTSSTGEVKPFLLDEAAAWITGSTPGGFSMLNMLASIPALGTCGALGGGAINLSSASGMPPGAVGLDAGPGLTLATPVGLRPMPPGKNDDDTPAVGMYGVTGQGGSTDTPPFVEPGAYTLSGPGGKDVGPFTANFAIPQPLTWTNKDTVTLDRAAGGTFTWSGGTDAQYVMLAGGGQSADGQASVGFICFVPAAPGTFTVPASVLANLPPPDPAQNGQNAGLVFGVVPAVQTHFTAPGLDDGVIFYGLFQAAYGGVK